MSRSSWLTVDRSIQVEAHPLRDQSLCAGRASKAALVRFAGPAREVAARVVHA